jgi:WD40 repeat protein
MHVWDVRPLLSSTSSTTTTTPSRPLQKLTTIRRHTRPIESLVLDDSSIEFLPGGGVEATFFSADSMGVVCRWVISRIKDGDGDAEGEDRVEVKEVAELRGHKTSVADMVVAEGGLWTGRFYFSLFLPNSLDDVLLGSGLVETYFHPNPHTASVDTTVLFHPFSTIPTVPIPIPHPYYVKSLLLLPPTFHPTPLLLTGSTDESIRVWDVSDVLEGAAEAASTRGRDGGGDVPLPLPLPLPTAKEMKPVQGHCHEVSALCTWIKDVDGQEGKKEAWVVSAGLDGTIRRWSMQGEPPRDTVG